MPEPRTVAATSASPLTAVYAAGYHELAGQIAGSNPEPRKIRSLNAIHVVMQLVATEEIHKMEKWMSFLATTGSVTPFIGLFGTVVGVMDAFVGLGTAGAASLRAVAPGIAEALITTAAGLFAAIPAVIAYNHFLHEIKDFATRLNNFAAEFSAQVEKNYNT
ncbi:MAG: MotA/TolQ/ExbB proton channel family protein [Acidobacteria bacterium]|nr:MotA/TolQ/ExbB proton channel family protein [Acidobacteriota bacterium]